MLLGGVAFSRLDCIDNRPKWDGGSERPVANAQQKLTQVTPPPPSPEWKATMTAFNFSIQFQHSISTSFCTFKTQLFTDKPHFMDAHLLQTPLYYRQFALYLGKESLFFVPEICCLY